MEKIIVTTCGTSLYRSSCWTGLESLRISLLSPEISSPEEIYRRQSTCEGVIREYQKEDGTGKTLADKFDVESWQELTRLKDLPAELASLRCIKEYCSATDNPIDTNDEIILLHSNNVEGFFCASVLSGVLGMLKSMGPLPAMVRTLPIEGLDPENSKAFSDALRGMRLNVKKMMVEHEHRQTEFLFNLTGGYKGVVIALSAVAYGRNANNHVSIFYLHESVSHGGIAKISFKDGVPREGVFDPTTRENYNVANVDIVPPEAF